MVHRGTSNNLFQVATLIRAATALEIKVRVLFDGDAALKLRTETINADDWAPIYDTVKSELAARLRAADFDTMETFLRDAKDHGDDVRFWISEETLTGQSLDLHDCVPYIDGAISRDRFDAEVADASARLSF